MSQIFCVKCGKAHTTNEKYCEYCGTNLEPILLKFKQQQT